jgi:hypothetical protein
VHVSSYKHEDLPYGKDLQGEKLRLALSALFEEYTTNVVVAKLAPAENSQRNESLNNVIGSKNLKTRFYGGSESSDFRVACGVAQKNIGHDYVCKTLESINIQPGYHCKKHSITQDKKSVSDALRKSSCKYKRRRKQLGTKRLCKNALKEKKEGTSYETNIGLNLQVNSTLESQQVQVIDKLKVIEDIDVNIYGWEIITLTSQNQSGT